MSRAYYNEIDPHAAQWLRNLIDAGEIAHGDVDERDIRDITPSDLAGYTQCHFFAGIGVWSYALRMAGWPDDRPVWTGSCPCQPFSEIGRGEGFADERHLWPHWHHLISIHRPPVVFGEQVASKDGLGWLDLVQADMEGTHYAFWPADLCAAGVGAPHMRQRLFFVGEAAGRLGHAHNPRLEGHGGDGAQASGRPLAHRPVAEASGHRHAGPTNGGWANPDWLRCRDGKWRPVESGTCPMAHGVAGRVGLLRAYGNAIVSELAAHFIAAYLDHEADQARAVHAQRGREPLIEDLL